MRLRTVLSGKIHRATVTYADLDYVGSVTVDADLLERADMVGGEQVHIWNTTNGERIVTYTIVGERGSGVIGINGPAAMRCKVGDIVIIAAFAHTSESETIRPRAVLVDEKNRFLGYADVQNADEDNRRFEEERRQNV